MNAFLDGYPAAPEDGQDRFAVSFEALFYTIDVGLCLLDASLCLVAVNSAMKRLFRHKHFEKGAACYQKEDGPGLCSHCVASEVLAAGTPMRQVVEEVLPDGGIRFVSIECHPVVGASGHVLGLVEIARDVTRHEQAERDVALAVRDIEMLLDSIRSILVSLDGDNRIRRFNASAEAAFGVSADAVAGRDFFSVGIDWDGEAVRQAVQTSRRTLQPVRVDEVRCRTADGAERLLGLTVNPVPRPRGENVEVLLLGQDLTAIKAREFRLIHERRMQAIGRLAAGIAHEINTPIQYVGYNTGFLDEAFTDVFELLDAYERLASLVDEQPDAAVREALGVIRRKIEEMDFKYLRQEIPAAIANSRKGIRQVEDIVGAMRQLSHPGSGNMAFFDLNGLVRDSLTITRNAWKHVATMTPDLAEGLPLVYGLPHEVSQVLINVIINAAQAVEERSIGQPWFRGRIDVSTYVQGEHVVVAVADNGPGIPESDRGRIFDPFFTTKPVGKGTGQGLAISHAVMARHVGGIDFTTRLGEGTTFFIRFPTEEDRSMFS